MIDRIFKRKQIKELQEKINQKESALSIVNDIKRLYNYKNPSESIIRLHWIVETLLKKILNNNKIISKNIKEYHRQYPESIININIIKEAISLRNKVIHGGLKLDNSPNTKEFAITTYIKYIEIISYENSIDLDKFIPPSFIVEEILDELSIDDEQEDKKNIKFWVIGAVLVILLYSLFDKTLNPKFWTGSLTGTYYPIAQGIKEKIAPDIMVLESEGSIANMNHIGLSQPDEALFAFVQNDVLQYLSKEALSGDIDKQDILNKTKVLMPIYDGEIHILVREDNLDIKNFRDLKDKKISIGMKDSGTAITAKSFYFKLFHEEINKVYQPFEEALKELKDKSVDAIVLTGGQPLSKLNKKMNKVRLISYEGEALNGYDIGYIRKDSYPWLKQEKIKTLSIKSFIVTNIHAHHENALYLKKFIKKLKEYKLNLRKENHLQPTHPKLEDLAKHRCLSTLPRGLEYHQLVKWNTPWCKKE